MVMFSMRLLVGAALAAVVVSSESSLAATATAGVQDGPPTLPGQLPVPPAVDASSKNIVVSPFFVNGAVSDLKWMGVNAQVVIMLSAQGLLYRSTDEGVTWVEQNILLNMPKYAFRKLIQCKFHENKLFIVGEGKISLMTKDGGKTWEQTKTEYELTEVSQNPTDHDLLLATAVTPQCKVMEEDTDGRCHKKLYVSRDWGKKWETLAKYVVQADWLHKMGPDSKAVKAHHGHSPPAHAIVATMMKQRSGHQHFGHWDSEVDFVRSDDFFRTEVVLVTGGNRFLMTPNYIFVAQVLRSRKDEVFLRLSHDGGRSFSNANMPFKLRQHSYTVLDTSEDQVFLHVNHRGGVAKFGHVYISDAVGGKYTMSLPNNAREENGKCDFEKVQGLEGIYIANYVDNTEELVRWEEDASAQDSMNDVANFKSVGSRPEPVRHSVITFDKGGQWNYIAAPAFDAKGAPAVCGKPECSLHLHGATSRWGPFYSTKSATGLIMATGNIGKQLSEEQDDVNTYLSRDGGLEWFEVKKGSRIYEFGDHGGVIVMADDTRPIDQVEYSWDEGLSWTTVKISNKFMIDNIIVEPHSKSTRFLVYGMRDDEKLSSQGQGVVVSLDFSKMHERVCKDHDHPDADSSDYEHWTPSDGRAGEHCLLGHTTQYTRRKRASQCYNPINHERAFVTHNCKCTAVDYECDAGHARAVNGGPCLRVTEQQRRVLTTTSMSMSMLDMVKMTNGMSFNNNADHRVGRALSRVLETTQSSASDADAEAANAEPVSVSNEGKRLGALSVVPANCPHGGTYTISNGYRKVAGNTCRGGEDFMPTVYPCPTTGFLGVSSSGWFVLFVVVVLVLGMCMLTYKSKSDFDHENKAFGTQDFGNAVGVVRGTWESVKGGAYTMLGKGDDAYQKVASGEVTKGWGMGGDSFGGGGGGGGPESAYNYSSVGGGDDDDGMGGHNEYGDLEDDHYFDDDTAVAELIPATTSARPLPMPSYSSLPAAVPVLSAPPSASAYQQRSEFFDEV